MEFPKDPHELPMFIEQQFAHLIRTNSQAGYVWKQITGMNYTTEQALKLIAVVQADQIAHLMKDAVQLSYLRPIVVHANGKTLEYNPLR